MSATKEHDPRAKAHAATLIYSAFIAGLCSIIYELLIATTVSYFLGDSVTYFSLTIGIYMAAMGVGSFASKYIDHGLLKKFIAIELMLGLIGGISIPALYIAYSVGELFIPCYILFTVLIGFFIGLEIPFLTRLMENYNRLQFNIANVLSFDYLGALIATVSFPFILLPFFGVYQSSLIFGLVNMSIGFVILWVFSDDIGKGRKPLLAASILLTAIIAGMLIFSASALKHWDNSLYADRIIHSEQTRYQKIVLTKDRDDIRLFLNGNLQFSSVDEHRYHEALIHVPLSMQSTPVRRVLLLGAGDGMAVRELLKYPSIQEITLVDLDEKMILLARENRHLSRINQHSLDSSRVNIVIADAFTYLKENRQQYDFIICDLPDPNNISLARLYSKHFYSLMRRNLSADGIFVTQATSPYFATEAFWCINKTVQAAFSHVYPYHAHIPSFGDWGFVLAAKQEKKTQSATLRVKTEFFDLNMVNSLFTFEKDIRPVNVAVNKLDQPILLKYYLKGWEYYAR